MNTSSPRLTRSRNNRIIGGVAGGIGAYLRVDPVLVRLVIVVLTLTTGVGLLLYPVFWAIMPLEQEQPGAVGYASPHGTRIDFMVAGDPPEPEEIPINNADTRASSAAQPNTARRNETIGLVLLGLGGLLLFKMILPGFAPFLLPLLMIGAGVVLLRRRER